MERMKEPKDVDWKAEIASFLTERVKHYERLKVLKEVREIVEKVPVAEPRTVLRRLREDHDSS